MLLEMSIFLCNAKIHFFYRRCDFESGHGVGTRSSIPRLKHNLCGSYLVGSHGGKDVVMEALFHTFSRQYCCWQ